MIDALYDQAILQKAREATGAGRLAEPDGSAMIDNPLCGDRVTIDLTLADGKVATLGHLVRGCVLCEASAALIAEQAIGQAPAALRQAAAAIRPMLREGAAPPWPELEIFTPVRAVRSRHDCVELPFRALTAALDKAGA
ncbi:iron-sulfur cluster assembly scaffold protein [Mycobacterium sp. KBS0706]|jgi:nitrogen fixation NifU-like protein|uniref:iron-sulfur cluster assembly scaffold protein n=1 Tax=Mycobacterium sp. KBS0706 TaxID=2578109 RepID=UPI00110FF6E9|nr:iron-sulfur cluster assembly scaffold protein [Mycobacterium sp. KBS0706]TSD89043.1 iron-sulfur cluster assembly scaffold protein [Mycobacterium sp. KBS0706]